MGVIKMDEKKSYTVYCLVCEMLNTVYLESPPNIANITLEGMKYPVVANCNRYEKLDLTGV